jgi:hypothetical protein
MEMRRSKTFAGVLNQGKAAKSNSKRRAAATSPDFFIIGHRVEVDSGFGTLGGKIFSRRARHP